jgi:UDP:flavonoid glycosyltransferase YjiC (YdhE family)
MHAILVCLGSDGDVFPYVGLGTRLRARGHQVTLTSNESYQSLAAEHGFGFRMLASTSEIDQLLGHPDIWHPLKSGWLAARWGGRFIGRQVDLLAELTRDPEAVLVASPFILAARIVQEKLACRLASIALMPWMIPSVFEPPVLPGLTLPRRAPRWVGHLYWRLIDVTGDLLAGRAFNRVRASLGLKPVHRMFQWWLSPDLAVGLFPDWYAPPQADWPPQLRLAGFPEFDGHARAELPAEVRAFCDAGSPPIAFTLGTAMQFATGFFRSAIEACGLLGRRGILLTKYPQQLPASLPPFINPCRFAPFRDLLPLCAAVVHHGGIGTTARALASGTPQVVCPMAFDQMDNAQRVKRLDAGVALGRRQWTGQRLAEALAGLLTPERRVQCQTVAARFGDTDTLDVAAGWIEGMIT